MKIHLAVAAVAVLCLTGLFLMRPARADAVVVIGAGPERECYVAAKTGIDPLGGIAACNLAMNNGLILHDRAATLVNRGVIENQLGRLQPSIDDFNECLRLVPDQPDAFLNRGVSKLSQTHYAEALADIQKGIDLGPSDPAVAYFDRGIAYERLGRIADAYYDYQRALKEAPGFTAAANALTRFRVVSKPKA